MPVLYLTEHDVTKLLDMGTAIDVVEEAFRQMADKTATNVPRVRAKSPGIVLHSMCAAAEYLGLVGWKCYTTTRAGARFHVGLYDAATGELVALVEADRLGQLRTGATTGVATGGVLGGTLGWLAGIGALSITGLGPLIAAGPIVAAVSGAAVGAGVGGLTGGLVGMGIPEYEAKRYEGKVRDGNILISVHAEDGDQRSLAKAIFEGAGAEDVSTVGESRPSAPA